MILKALREVSPFLSKTGQTYALAKKIATADNEAIK